MKIVVNKCYGGFGLSVSAIRRLAKLKGHKVYFYTRTKYSFRDGVDEYTKVKTDVKSNGSLMMIHAVKDNLGPKCTDEQMNAAQFFNERDIDRNDPDLVKVVEDLGEKANGQFAELQVTEIPNDVEWKIDEYDGQEWVAEVHRTW